MTPNRLPPNVSVIIPAFNEATRLPGTIEEVAAYLRRTNWTWEVRVVDDGSLDETADVAERCSRTEPRVIVQREPHRGKGGAVKAGVLAACGEYRFICDADLSMPIRELARFLPPELDGADVAIATREGPGARRVGEPIRRHLVGRAFNYLVQVTLLGGLNDTQCGFKMFTAAAVDRVFPRVTIDGWSFDIEALYIARELGLRIVEVPIEWHFRKESRLNVGRDGLRMFRELLYIRGRAKAGAYGPVSR